MYWAVRERGDGSSFAASRMMDISRAYDILTLDERRLLFNGVWLERSDIPNAVITKMLRYLNGGTP